MMKWIDIEDKRPEIPEDRFVVPVFCTLIEEGEDSWVQNLIWDGQQFMEEDCGYDGWESFPVISCVTHWMYYPDPYKECNESN